MKIVAYLSGALVALAAAGCGKSSMPEPQAELKLHDTRSSTFQTLGSTVVLISYNQSSGTLNVDWDDDMGQFQGPYTLMISGCGPTQTAHTGSISYNTTMWCTPGATITVKVQPATGAASTGSIIVGSTNPSNPELLPYIDCAVTAASPYIDIEYHFTWSTTPYQGMTDSLYFYIEDRDYVNLLPEKGMGGAAFNEGSFTLRVPRLARWNDSNRDQIWVAICYRRITQKYPPFTPTITYQYTIPGLDWFGHWTW
ncbi:hypothetical protein [Chitinophaga caseinilytica]|uniref:Fibronectin type-III domain-containing protein n=1 Tax=Chitinophaga caseinilytica TaxID=2267521 RepID=A0ABZ2Z8X5_9BACT